MPAVIAQRRQKPAWLAAVDVHHGANRQSLQLSDAVTGAPSSSPSGDTACLQLVSRWLRTAADSTLQSGLLSADVAGLGHLSTGCCSWTRSRG